MLVYNWLRSNMMKLSCSTHYHNKFQSRQWDLMIFSNLISGHSTWKVITRLSVCLALFPMEHGMGGKRLLPWKWRKACKQNQNALQIWRTQILSETYYHCFTGSGQILWAIIPICMVKYKHQLLGLLEVRSYYTVHTNMKGNHIHISEDYFTAQDCMNPIIP